MTDSVGRLLAFHPDDPGSVRRTPRQRLRAIPPAAMASFTPVLPELPALRIGENDLTRIAAGRPRADGEAIEVSGRIMDVDGRPARNTLVEIWAANAYGRYAHAEDHFGHRLDPNYLGFGRAVTDEDGGYRFRAIYPGRYVNRACHIHFSLRGGGVRLVTQMYFPGDPCNETDPIALVLGDALPRHIGRPYASASTEISRCFRFDIVVSGRNAVVFEADQH